MKTLSKTTLNERRGIKFFLKNNSFFLEERFFDSIRKLKNTEFGNLNSVFIFYMFFYDFMKKYSKISIL